jgi:hypothetical protein
VRDSKVTVQVLSENKRFESRPSIGPNGVHHSIEASKQHELSSRGDKNNQNPDVCDRNHSRDPDNGGKDGRMAWGVQKGKRRPEAACHLGGLTQKRP